MLLRRYKAQRESVIQGKPIVNELDNLTKKELSELLDAKGIEYNARANKEELIKLLEDAE